MSPSFSALPNAGSQLTESPDLETPVIAEKALLDNKQKRRHKTVIHECHLLMMVVMKVALFSNAQDCTDHFLLCGSISYKSFNDHYSRINWINEMEFFA